MELIALIILSSTTLIAGQRPFHSGGNRSKEHHEFRRRANMPIVGFDTRYGDSLLAIPRPAVERDLLDRIRKLTNNNKTPFWFTNRQSLEMQRQNHYPLRQNSSKLAKFFSPILTENSTKKDNLINDNSSSKFDSISSNQSINLYVNEFKNEIKNKNNKATESTESTELNFDLNLEQTEDNDDTFIEVTTTLSNLAVKNEFNELLYLLNLSPMVQNTAPPRNVGFIVNITTH